MIGWVIAAAYITVTLLAARRFHYYMRADSPPDDGDRVDAALLGVLAFLAGLFWPLALPAAIVLWHPRKTSGELSAEIAKRDQRIAELEREAGIK